MDQIQQVILRLVYPIKIRDPLSLRNSRKILAMLIYYKEIVKVITKNSENKEYNCLKVRIATLEIIVFLALMKRGVSMG